MLVGAALGGAGALLQARLRQPAGRAERDRRLGRRRGRRLRGDRLPVDASSASYTTPAVAFVDRPVHHAADLLAVAGGRTHRGRHARADGHRGERGDQRRSSPTWCSSATPRPASRSCSGSSAASTAPVGGGRRRRHRWSLVGLVGADADRPAGSTCWRSASVPARHLGLNVERLRLVVDRAGRAAGRVAASPSPGSSPSSASSCPTSSHGHRPGPPDAGPGQRPRRAFVLVVADLVARTAVDYADLPIGMLTALVGGPFFFWLLRRDPRRIGRLGDERSTAAAPGVGAAAAAERADARERVAGRHRVASGGPVDGARRRRPRRSGPARSWPSSAPTAPASRRCWACSPATSPPTPGTVVIDGTPFGPTGSHGRAGHAPSGAAPAGRRCRSRSRSLQVVRMGRAPWAGLPSEDRRRRGRVRRSMVDTDVVQLAEPRVHVAVGRRAGPGRAGAGPGPGVPASCCSTSRPRARHRATRSRSWASPGARRRRRGRGRGACTTSASPPPTPTGSSSSPAVGFAPRVAERGHDRRAAGRGLRAARSRSWSTRAPASLVVPWRDAPIDDRCRSVRDGRVLR